MSLYRWCNVRKAAAEFESFVDDLPTKGRLGFDIPTGQRSVNETLMDRPDGLDEEEIEWAREQGAQSIDEVYEYIHKHKDLNKER